MELMALQRMEFEKMLDLAKAVIGKLQVAKSIHFISNQIEEVDGVETAETIGSWNKDLDKGKRTSMQLALLRAWAEKWKGEEDQDLLAQMVWPTELLTAFQAPDERLSNEVLTCFSETAVEDLRMLYIAWRASTCEEARLMEMSNDMARLQARMPKISTSFKLALKASPAIKPHWKKAMSTIDVEGRRIKLSTEFTAIMTTVNGTSTLTDLVSEESLSKISTWMNFASQDESFAGKIDEMVTTLDHRAQGLVGNFHKLAHDFVDILGHGQQNSKPKPTASGQVDKELGEDEEDGEANGEGLASTPDQADTVVHIGVEDIEHAKKISHNICTHVEAQQQASPFNVGNFRTTGFPFSPQGLGKLCDSVMFLFCVYKYSHAKGQDSGIEPVSVEDFMYGLMR